MGITLWSWFASTGDPRQLDSLVAIPRPPNWVTMIAMVGTYSYSIYLWHMPLATASSKFIWNRIFRPDEPAALAELSVIYISLAIMIGVILYLAIEGPALAIRDRVFPGMARIASTRPLGKDIK